MNKCAIVHSSLFHDERGEQIGYNVYVYVSDTLNPIMHAVSLARAKEEWPNVNVVQLKSYEVRLWVAATDETLDDAIARIARAAALIEEADKEITALRDAVHAKVCVALGIKPY